MNEGESATNTPVIFELTYYNTQMIHNKIHATFTHVLAYKTPEWSKSQTTRIHKFFTVFV